MLESTTKRGGRESDNAMPNLPTETPSGYSACASAKVPGYLKPNPFPILH